MIEDERTFSAVAPDACAVSIVATGQRCQRQRHHRAADKRHELPPLRSSSLLEETGAEYQVSMVVALTSNCTEMQRGAQHCYGWNFAFLLWGRHLAGPKRAGAMSGLSADTLLAMPL